MKKSIEGKNKMFYNCYICGSELKPYDFYQADDMCSRCRNAMRQHTDFVDNDGSNKIDAILLEKYRKQRR